MFIWVWFCSQIYILCMADSAVTEISHSSGYIVFLLRTLTIPVLVVSIGESKHGTIRQTYMTSDMWGEILLPTEMLLDIYP